MSSCLPLLAAALFAGFFVQTVVGFAAGILALPVILSCLNLQEAIAFTSVFLSAFTLILLRNEWSRVDRSIFRELAPGTIIGLVLGVFILQKGEQQILERGLGIFTLSYVAYSYARQRQVQIFLRLGFLFGLVGGVFSGLFSSGGPLFVSYITNRYKDPDTIRATTIGFLAIPNFLRLILLGGTGLLTPEILEKCLLVSPAFLLAIYLGRHFESRLDKKILKHLVMIFLAISGAELLFK